ncbi:MAG: hypothetical protein IPP46_10690 [Bacteroidetes bacterium]|nr:hypothetical protein [Bacteroidota bacterium]
MTPFGVIEGRTSWIQTISFLPPIIVFGSLMFDPVRGHRGRISWIQTISFLHPIIVFGSLMFDPVRSKRGKNIVDTNHFLSSSYHRLRVIDV